jgi:hypothetical protein
VPIPLSPIAPAPTVEVAVDEYRALCAALARPTSPPREPDIAPFASAASAVRRGSAGPWRGPLAPRIDDSRRLERATAYGVLVGRSFVAPRASHCCVRRTGSTAHLRRELVADSARALARRLDRAEALRAAREYLAEAAERPMTADERPHYWHTWRWYVAARARAHSLPALYAGLSATADPASRTIAAALLVGAILRRMPPEPPEPREPREPRSAPKRERRRFADPRAALAAAIDELNRPGKSTVDRWSRPI